MTEIVFKRRLAARPEVDTNIFRLRTPSFSEKALLDSARSLELDTKRSARRLVATADEMSYAEGRYAVSIVKRSGALRYVDTTKFQIDDGETDIEMSDDDAIATAQHFVERMNLVPLADCKPLRVTRLRVGTLRKGSRRASERVIDVGVLFQRFIDGVPVFGGGGKLMVYLDKQKDLIGFEKVWRDIMSVTRPVPWAQLREPTYAEASLKRRLTRVLARRVEVDSMSFGYYEGGVCDTQSTLQPVYFMPIELTTDGTMVMRSHVVVPAAERPVGTIIPIKRPGPAEPVRR